MTERENILRFIGLAKRAGKLESGTDGVIKALRTGRAKLLIADEVDVEVVQGGMMLNGLHVDAFGEGDQIVIVNAGITVYVKS